GATYTLSYTYFDLPALCAAWWSATGRNPADWIRANQGDWLGRMVRFELWYMRPGFAFTNLNDQFRGDWDSHDEFCQGLDLAAYVTRDGHGRAWSNRWLGRFGPALYHPEYADQYHRNAASANVVLFTDPDKPDDRGDQNTRKGLKTDHATWDQWLKIRERN